jgi:hypothetical protein
VNESINSAAAQNTLAAQNIEAFYHDLFVTDQVADFRALVAPRLPQPPGTVVDIGGGCGYFAAAVQRELGVPVRVLDSDPVSIAACAGSGVEAVLDDALAPVVRGDETVACFNLILHHLVAAGEGDTRVLQERALRAWQGRASLVFVNEYIYESWIWRDASARLIFLITNSGLLSRLAAALSRFVPSLRANTFGVGVRFRPRGQWVQIFESCGYRVEGVRTGTEEPVSLPRRLLGIRNCRRDSFLLRAA